MRMGLGTVGMGVDDAVVFPSWRVLRGAGPWRSKAGKKESRKTTPHVTATPRPSTLPCVHMCGAGVCVRGMCGVCVLWGGKRGKVPFGRFFAASTPSP